VKKALESFKVFDKTLLFMGKAIEKFPLCVYEISKLIMSFWQDIESLAFQVLVCMHKLFKSSGVDGFYKTTFFDSLFFGAMTSRAKSSSSRTWRRCWADVGFSRWKKISALN